MSVLGNMVEEAIRTALRAARMALPGKIVSYSSLTQTAEVDIQVEIPLNKLNGRSEVLRGEHIYEELPKLHGVPVGHPRGGGFFVHFPMEAGDFVWVMFSDQSMDEFIRTGTVSKPVDTRSHDLFPYALPASDPSIPNRLTPGLPSDELVVGREGGSEIRFKQNNEVHIAGEADFLARADRTESQLQIIVTALTTAVTGSMDGGALYKTNIIALLTDPVGSVASDKVKGT